MSCSLKVQDGRIQEARYQLLGCPGAISAAMALADPARGKADAPAGGPGAHGIPLSPVSRASTEEPTMPLFDHLCLDCGETTELLVVAEDDEVRCGACGGTNLKRLLSAHSSLSGTARNAVPGPGDTACCGSSPDRASCAGPGSCCGKAPVS